MLNEEDKCLTQAVNETFNEDFRTYCSGNNCTLKLGDYLDENTDCSAKNKVKPHKVYD